MNQSVQRWIAGACSVAALGLVLARTEADGDKGAWQPILSKEVYEELAKREAEAIKAILDAKPDEDALRRAKFGAVMLAAYSKSIKPLDGTDNQNLIGVRERAVQLVDALKKDTLPRAQELLKDILQARTMSKSSPGQVHWDKLIERPDLMDHFRTKDKGGDGIHADLQSNIRLKGTQNGIEEKLRALGMKELAAAGMKKEAKELELLAYRTAVVSSLTYYFAPAMKVGKKDPDEWRTLSLQSRDAAVGLAQAAKKGDTAAVFKASNSLNSACNQCHSTFRN